MIKTVKQIEKLVTKTPTIRLKHIRADRLIKLKKYAESYSKIYPPIGRHGKIVTGLSETHDVDGQTVKGTREYMEKRLDLTEGTLKQSSTFWDTYNVMLGTDDEVFNLSEPDDLLAYLMLQAHPLVAVGMAESNKNAKAVFVLYSEAQTAIIANSTRKDLKKAYKVTESLDTETMIDILAVYGLKSDSNSFDDIQNKVDEKAEENPTKFLSIVNDSNLANIALVNKCLSAGILTADNGSIKHGDIVLGHDNKVSAQAVKKDSKLQKILKAKLSGNTELLSEI